MAKPICAALTILRPKQLQARTGRCRSSLYEDIAAGTFPAPVKLGPRAVGWVESEVNDWIADRVEMRGKSADGRDTATASPRGALRSKQIHGRNTASAKQRNRRGRL